MKALLYFAVHNFAIWLARKTVDPRLNSVMDKVYDRLDYEMPFILRTSNFGSVNNLISGLVVKETGIQDEGVLGKLVDQVCQAYDPRNGAKG
jgi:hypothetical protein